MHKISIRKKLILGFGIVVLIGFIGSLFSVNEMRSLKNDIQELVDVSVVRMNYLSEAEVAYGNVKIAGERWNNPFLSAEQYEAQFAVVAKAMEAVNKDLNAYQEQQAAMDADEKARLSELMVCHADHDKKMKQIVDFAGKVKGKPDAAKLVAEAYIDLGIDVSRTKFETAFEALQMDLIETSTEIVQDAIDTVQGTIAFAVIVMLVSLVVGLLIGIFFARSITGVATQISQALLQNSGNITVSTQELASGSQALAAGATQQAASVEEISASLEEIASMVRQNSDNAQNASELVAQTGMTLDTTQKAMQRSQQANEEISMASNEINKIIKVIDDIAFQTNLLSLNAAVEAARAGDAGAGFAVVAGEVRGLAMRSAEASKRTAELIEQTIEKVREGMETFAETEKNFNMAVNQAQEVRQLVSQVAAASEEQSKGIEQINIGVSEMEKVIQMNAANSEQSAASTQELAAQSNEMISSVRSFEEFIFGSRHIEE